MYQIKKGSQIFKKKFSTTYQHTKSLLIRKKINKVPIYLYIALKRFKIALKGYKDALLIPSTKKVFY
tara:strand:- start:1 stop:201 length:201 start_codon:yes stop_codon:yes gene_type:complete